MRYPNLTAEYEASGYHISVLAEHANTSKEHMQETLYGDQELLLHEFCALYGLFSDFGNYRHYQMSYLASPKLSAVDPATNKGRYQTVILREKLTRIPESELTDSRHVNRYHQAQRVLAALEEGRAVKYAFYRRALLDLDSIRYWLQRRSSRMEYQEGAKADKAPQKGKRKWTTLLNFIQPMMNRKPR